MKEIFESREANRVLPDNFKLNLNIPKHNRVTLGCKFVGVFYLEFGIIYLTTLNFRKM